MPKIAQRTFFNGTEEKLTRLGLRGIWDQLESVLTAFQLQVLEQKDSNGGAAVRELLDARFRNVGGWDNKQSGGVDWIKCHIANGTKVCVGVEVQFSARSDLLIVDVQHLRDDITTGKIDVGVIVVPSDRLAYFLTDRVARYTDAVKAVERARAADLPLAVIALEHDGPGTALLKRQTRQGKKSAT
jgi:restriction endonuclease BglII